ncbi:MAG: hypothetical protein ABEI86_09475, partial [Halobacteriaceae archaeon]
VWRCFSDRLYNILIMSGISNNISHQRNVSVYLVTGGETGMVTAPKTTVSVDGFRYAMELGGAACRTVAERYDCNRQFR